MIFIDFQEKKQGLKYNFAYKIMVFFSKINKLNITKYRFNNHILRF